MVAVQPTRSAPSKRTWVLRQPQPGGRRDDFTRRQSGGASSVCAVAATLAISEVLRLLDGGPVNSLLDLDLLSLDPLVASLHNDGFGGMNPGFAQAQ